MLDTIRPAERRLRVNNRPDEFVAKIGSDRDGLPYGNRRRRPVTIVFASDGHERLPIAKPKETKTAERSEK